MPNCTESLRSGKATRCAVCMANMVSCCTTRGESRFVLRTASIASELAGKVTAIEVGWLQIAFNEARENRPRAL
jgi:hypothetical protein